METAKIVFEIHFGTVLALFFVVLFYVDGQMYLAGHNSTFFSHKTSEEKRIREAQIRILEKEAGIGPVQD